MTSAKAEAKSSVVRYGSNQEKDRLRGRRYEVQGGRLPERASIRSTFKLLTA